MYDSSTAEAMFPAPAAKPQSTEQTQGLRVLYQCAMKRTLSALGLLMILAGCSSPPRPGLRPVAPHAPELTLLSYVHKGLRSDSLEAIAGEPKLIVDGIPYVQTVTNSGKTTISIEKSRYNTFETWFFGPSRFDTIHSQIPVTLFSTEFDSEPQTSRDVYLEYTVAVVIDKDSHRVDRSGYYPRGFLDSDGDIQLGAILEQQG